MKKSYMLLLLSLCMIRATAQVHNFARHFAGVGQGAVAGHTKMVTDDYDNIIAAGSFSGSLDLDPGVPADVYTAQTPGDAYIVKLMPNGTKWWAHRLEGDHLNRVTCLTTDDTGNVYMAGLFTGVLDANPGTGTYYLTSASVGSYDYYIIKFDASGNFKWAKSEESEMAGFDPAQQRIFLGVGYTGNIWMAKEYQYRKVVLKEFSNSTGTIVRSSQMQPVGVKGSAYLGGLSVNDLGDMLITGSFTDTVDFDPGIAIHTEVDTDMAGNSGFVAKVDTAGVFQWVQVLATEGNGTCYAQQVAFDGTGSMLISGRSEGVTDFDPGSGIHYDTTSGNTGRFILKLTVSGGFDWLSAFTTNYRNESVNLVTNTNRDVFASGAFSGTLQLQANNKTLTATCPSDAHTFLFKLTSTGDAGWLIQMGAKTGSTLGQDIATNRFGELILTGTYQDSMRTAWHTPNVLTLTNPGHTNPYIVSMSNCDVDVSVTRIDNEFTANMRNVDYEWVNCATGIVVATGQTFNPTANGKYKLIINNGGCFDSTSCYTVTGVHVAETPLANAVKAWPNPTTGITTIALSGTHTQVMLEVRTAMGQLVQTKAYRDASEIQVQLDGPAGIYFINLATDDGQRAYLHVLKQ